MADWNEELYWETATGLGRRLAAREISAMECARAFCGRLERLGPRFRALALPLQDDTLQQAKEADREIKRGRTRGPLHGVPCGISDLLSVSGRPTAWGSGLFAGQVFPDHAAAVERARKAGAVVAGKLMACELGGAGMPPGWPGDAAGGGLNPHDNTHWAGGACGAAAAAVGAGLTPFSLGLDTGGSLLRPAGFCGVTALRPTFGTVSRFGAAPVAWTVDSIAVAARSAEDCGHILAAICGTDARDPGSPGRRFLYAPQYSRPVEQLRIGYVPGEFPAALRPVLETVLKSFRAAGSALVELPAIDLPCSEALEVIVASESAAAFSDLVADGRAGRLADPRQAAGLKAGMELKAGEYLRAMQVRRMVQEWLGLKMAEADLLISPLSLELPPTAGPGTHGTPAPLPALLAAGVLAGLPLLALPAGEAGGLPAGLLLAARPRMDNVLLKAAADFEARNRGILRHPKY